MHARAARRASCWRCCSSCWRRRVGGGYVFTVGEGDRIEFRDTSGNLLPTFSRLSDDTVLGYPYGVQVIEYPG